ncbi:MAG: Hsp20/alpha crystallin family protein [Rikenellaceae bacterium]
MLPSKRSQNWLPSIFNDFIGNEWIAKSNSVAPAMNIIETAKEYKIEIASPGLNKEDFTLKVNDQNHLVISVKRESHNTIDDKESKYLRREFSFSQFQQTLILPDNIDKDSIDASQQNGVLTVTIPKKEEVVVSNEKEIPIK